MLAGASGARSQALLFALVLFFLLQSVLSLRRQSDARERRAFLIAFAVGLPAVLTAVSIGL